MAHLDVPLVSSSEPNKSVPSIVTPSGNVAPVRNESQLCQITVDGVERHGDHRPTGVERTTVMT